MPGPFVGGRFPSSTVKKRKAFAAMYTFFAINGVDLSQAHRRHDPPLRPETVCDWRRLNQHLL